MTEPSIEQPDPDTIARPRSVAAGGRQEEPGPFLTTGTPLMSGVTSAERTQTYEQIEPYQQ